MGLHDLTGKEQQFQHAYEVSGWGCRISRVRNIRSNMHTMYQVGLQAPTGWELQIYMPTRFQELTSGYHGFETPDRTCIWDVRTVLHDITVSEHKVVHDYKVSGWGCRISRVWQTRWGWGFRISRIRNTVPTCIRGIRPRLQDLTGKEQQISRVQNTRSYTPTRWETSDRTCLQCIRSGLQDLTGWELQIVRAY